MRLTKTSIFAVAFLLISTIGSQAQVTAIRAGKLIDPESGTTSTNQTIIVEGGKIKAVGPGPSLPAGATVIDLSTFTVLPGLFDAHAHMCQTAPPDNRDLFTVGITTPSTYRAILGVVNAREMLESGFTTIRDVGNNGNYADTVDSFVEAGLPAKDILKIITTNAARLLGVDKQRGAIKVGQAADIIATPENPLDNIQTLKKVAFVMKNGKVFNPVK